VTPVIEALGPVLDRMDPNNTRYSGKGWQAKGSFFYPPATPGLGERPAVPGGFREWHTNRGNAGWRMYFVRNAAANGSTFSYMDFRTGQVHTNQEGESLVRLFKIPPSDNLWHCIRSTVGRWSFGVHISEDMARSIVESAGRSFWIEKPAMPVP